MPFFVSFMASGGHLRFSLCGVAVVSLLALGVHGDVADTSRVRGDGGLVDSGRTVDGFLYGEWLRDRKVYRFAVGDDSAVEQPGSFWADVAGEVRDSHWRRLRDVVVGALPRGGEVRDVFLRFGNGEEFDMREWREIRRRRIAGAFRDAPFAVVADVEAALSGALSGAVVERLAFVRRARIDFRTGLGNRIASGGVEALGALRESDDDAVGWQMRGYVGDGVDSGLNAGVFYRRVVNEFGEELLGGVNTFLDYEKNADAGGFWRWSVGGKVKSRLGEISANRYLALTDAKRLSSGTYYSRDGFDSEVFMNVPDVEWMRVSFGYYNWRGEFGDADDAGLRLGAQFNPGGGVRLGLEFDGGEGDLGGNISYAHTFGAPSPSRGSAARGFDPRAHFFDAVRREYSQRISRAGGAGDGANFAVIVGTGLNITIRGELPGTSAATVSTLNITAASLTTGVNDEFAITGNVTVETDTMPTASMAVFRQRGGNWTLILMADSELAFLNTARILSITRGSGIFNRINPPLPGTVLMQGITIVLAGTRFRFGVPPTIDSNNRVSIDLLEGGISLMAEMTNRVTVRVGERASVFVMGDGGLVTVGCNTVAGQSVSEGGVSVRCSGGRTIDLTPPGDIAANISVGGGGVIVPFGKTLTVARFAVPMLAEDMTLMASLETAGFALVTMSAANSVAFELVINEAASVAGAKTPRVSVWDTSGFFTPTVVQFAVRVARKLRVNVNPSQVGVTQNITAANIAVVNASEGTRDYLYSVITHNTLFNLTDGTVVNNHAQINNSGVLTVSLEATDALGDKATVDLTVNVAPTPRLALTPLGLLVVGTSEIAVPAGNIIAAGGATPLSYNIAIGNNNFAETANLPSSGGAATVNVTTGAIQIRGTSVRQTFDLYYQVRDSAPGGAQQTTVGTVLVSVSEGVALSGPILNATVTATTNGGSNTGMVLGTVMAQLRAGLQVRSFNIAGGHAVLRAADNNAARREVYYSGTTQTPDTVQLTIMVTDTSPGGAGDPPNSTEAVFYLAIVDPANVEAGLSGAVNLRYFADNRRYDIVTATASGGAGGYQWHLTVNGARGNRSGANIGNDGVLYYQGASTNAATVIVMADDNHSRTGATAAATLTLTAIQRARVVGIPQNAVLTAGGTINTSTPVTLGTVSLSGGSGTADSIVGVPAQSGITPDISGDGEIRAGGASQFVAPARPANGALNFVFRIIDNAPLARRQTVLNTMRVRIANVAPFNVSYAQLGEVRGGVPIVDANTTATILRAAASGGYVAPGSFYVNEFSDDGGAGGHGFVADIGGDRAVSSLYVEGYASAGSAVLTVTTSDGHADTPHRSFTTTIFVVDGLLVESGAALRDITTRSNDSHTAALITISRGLPPYRDINWTGAGAPNFLRLNANGGEVAVVQNGVAPQNAQSGAAYQFRARDQRNAYVTAAITVNIVEPPDLTLGFVGAFESTPQTTTMDVITLATLRVGGGYKPRANPRFAGARGDLDLREGTILVLNNPGDKYTAELAATATLTADDEHGGTSSPQLAVTVSVVAALRLNGGGEYIVTVGSRDITVATIRAVGGERGDGYQFTDPNTSAPFAALGTDVADSRVVKLGNTAIPANRNGQTDSLVFSVTDDTTPQAARDSTTLTVRYVNPINAAHTFKDGGGALTTASGSQVVGTITGSGGLGGFVYTEINNSPLNVNSDGEIAGTFTGPTTAVISVRVDDGRNGAQVAATHPVTIEVAVTALRPLAMPHTVFRITTNTHGARNDPTDWSLPLSQASGGQPPYFAVRPGCCNNYTRVGGYINPSRVLFLHNEGAFVWSGDATPTTEGAVVQDMIGIEDSSTPPRLYVFPLTMDFVFPPQVRVNTQLRTRSAQTGTSVTVVSLTYSGGASGGNLTASVEVSNGAARIDNNNVIWAGAAGGDATVFVHAYQSDNDTAPQSTATVVVNFVAPLTLTFGGGYESAPLTSAAAITIGTLQRSGGNGNYGAPTFVSNNRDFAFVEGTIVVLNNNSQRNQTERTVTAVIRADDTSPISAPATISVTVNVVDRVKLRGGGRITVFAEGDAGDVVAEFKPAGGIPPYSNLNKLLPSGALPSGLQESAAAKSVTITRTNTDLTAGDEHIIAYEVSDNTSGGALYATATATITVVNSISAAIDFAGGALTTGVMATVATISASGGVGDYTFSANNNALSFVEGTIAVANFTTPTTANINLIADDDNAPITEPATAGITVTALAPLAITPLEVMLTTGETTPADGTDSDLDIVASGGDGTYSYTYTGGGANSPLKLGSGNNLVWTGNQLQTATGTVVAEMLGVTDSSTPNRATMRAITLIYVNPPSVAVDNLNQSVNRYKNEVSVSVASPSFSGGSGAAGLTATVLGVEAGVTALITNNTVVVSASAGVTGDKQITIVGFDSDNDTAPATTATLSVHFVAPLGFANLPGEPLTVTTQDAQGAAVESGKNLPVQIDGSGGNTANRVYTPPANYTYSGGLLRHSGNTFPANPSTADVEIIVADTPAVDGYAQTATATVTVAFIDPPDLTIGFDGAFNSTPLTSSRSEGITIGTVVLGAGLNPNDPTILNGGGGDFGIVNTDSENSGTVELRLRGTNTEERVTMVTLTGNDGHDNTDAVMMTIAVTVVNRIKLNGGGRVTVFAGGAGAGAIATLAAVGGRGARTYGLATSPLPGYVSSAGGGAEALTLSYITHADATAGAAASVTATVADDDNTATATVEVTIIAPVSAAVDFAGGALTTGVMATVATIGASGGVGEYTFSANNNAVSFVEGTIAVANFASAATINVNLIADDDNAAITEPVTIGITLTALAPLTLAPPPVFTLTTGANPGSSPLFTLAAAQGGQPPFEVGRWQGAFVAVPLPGTEAPVQPKFVLAVGARTVVYRSPIRAPNNAVLEEQQYQFAVRDSSNPRRVFYLPRFNVRYVNPPGVTIVNVNQSARRYKNAARVTIASPAYGGGGGGAVLAASILGFESGITALAANNNIIVSAGAGVTGDKEITVIGFDSNNGTAPAATATLTVHFVAPLSFANLPSAPLTITTQDAQFPGLPVAGQGALLPRFVNVGGGNGNAAGDYAYNSPNAEFTYNDSAALRYNDGGSRKFAPTPATTTVTLAARDRNPASAYQQSITALVTVAFVDPPPLTIGFDGAFNSTPLTSSRSEGITIGTVVLGAGLNPNDPTILNGGGGDFGIVEIDSENSGTVELRLRGTNTEERVTMVTLTGNDAHNNTDAVMMTIAVTVVNRIKLNGGGRVTLFAGETGAIATLAAVGGRGARTYGLETSPLPGYVSSAGGGAEALTLSYTAHADATVGAAAFITATVADDDNTATATVEVTIIATIAAEVDFAGGALTTASAATVATLSASGGVGEYTFSANNNAVSFVEGTIAVANFASAATVTIDLIADDDNAAITEPATVGITLTALAPLVITPLAITVTTGETTPAAGADSNLDITASGGDGTYTYAFSGGGSSEPMTITTRVEFFFSQADNFFPGDQSFDGTIRSLRSIVITAIPGVPVTVNNRNIGSELLGQGTRNGEVRTTDNPGTYPVGNTNIEIPNAIGTYTLFPYPALAGGGGPLQKADGNNNTQLNWTGGKLRDEPGADTSGVMMVTDSSTPPRTAGETLTVIYVLPPSVAVTPSGLANRNATGETITVASLTYSGGATGGALTASLASSDGNVELIDNEVVVSVTTFARDLKVTIFAYQSDNDTAPNATVTLDVNLHDPFRANPRAAAVTITAGNRWNGAGVFSLLTLSVQGWALDNSNTPGIGMLILRGENKPEGAAPDALLNVFGVSFDNAGGGIQSGLQASVHYFGLQSGQRVPAIVGMHTVLLRASDMRTQPHTHTTNTIVVSVERGALFAVRDPQTLTIAAGTGANRTLGAVNALNLTYPPAAATVSVSLFAVAGALAGKLSLQVASPPNHATIIGLPVAAEEAPALLQFSLEIADITGDDNAPSAKATAAFSVTLLAPVSVGLDGGGKLVQVTAAADFTIGTITTSGGGGEYKNPVLRNNERDFALVNNTILVLRNTDNRNESERAATVEVVGDDNIDFTEEAVRTVIVTLVSSVRYEGGEVAVTVGASNFDIITVRAVAGDRPATGYNFGDPSPGAPFTIEMRDADDARVLKIGETAVAANLHNTTQTITFRVWDGNTPPLSATAQVTVLFINPLGASNEYKAGGGALTASIGVTIGEVSGAGGFGGYVYSAIGNDNNFAVKSNGEITAVFNNAATATLQVRVDDMRNNRAVPNTHPFTLSVVVTALHSISAPVFSLTVTTATNPGAIASTPAATLSVSGGQPPYTWLREVIPNIFQPNAADVLAPGVFYFGAHATLTYNNKTARSSAGAEAQRTDSLAVEDSSSPPRRFILPAATVYYVLPPAASVSVNQLLQRNASGKTVTAAALAYSGGASGGDVTATVLGASGDAAVAVEGGELLISARASGTVTATINAFDAGNDTAQNDSKTITVVFVEPLSLPDLPLAPLTVTTRDVNPQNAQAGVALPVLLTASGGNGAYTYKQSPAVTHNGGEGVNAAFTHNANGLLRHTGNNFPNTPLTAMVEVVVTDNETDGFGQTLTADVTVAFVHPPALAIAFGGAFNNTPQTVAAETAIIIGTVVMTGGAGALNLNLASGADDGFALNAIVGEAGAAGISAQLLLGGDNTSRRRVTAKITGDDNHPGTEPATLDAVVEVSDALRVEDVVVTFTIGAALPADNTPAYTIKVNGGVKPYSHFHNTPVSGPNPHQRIRGDALLGPDNVLRWTSVGVLRYGPGPMRRAPAASVVQMSVSSLNQQGATFGVNDAVGAARPYIIYAHFVALTAQVSVTRIIPLSQFNTPGASATVANLTFGGGAHGGVTARAPGAENGAASVVNSQLVMSTPDSPVSVEVVATVVGYDADTAGVPESTILVTARFNHPLRANTPRLTLTTSSRYGSGAAVTVSAFGGVPPYTYLFKKGAAAPSSTPADIAPDNVLRYAGDNVIRFVNNQTRNTPGLRRQQDVVVVRDSASPPQEFEAALDIEYAPKPLEVNYQQVLNNVVANDQFAVVANITDIPFANETYTVIGVSGIVVGNNDPRTVTTRVEFSLHRPADTFLNRPEFIGRLRSYTRLVLTAAPGRPVTVVNRNIYAQLLADGNRRALILETNEPNVFPVGTDASLLPDAPATYTLFPYPAIIANQGGARISGGDLQMRSRVLAQDVVASIAVIDAGNVFPGGTAQVTVDFVPPPVVISESGIDDRIVNTGEYTVGVFAISGGEGALSFTHNAGGNVGAYNFGLALNAAGDIATATLSAPRNGKLTITVSGDDSHPFTPAARFVWTVTVTHAPITVGAPSFNGIAQRAGGGGAGAQFTVAGGLLTGEHYAFNLLGNNPNVSALDDELRISVSNFAAPTTLTLTFSIDDDDNTAPAATGTLTATIQIQDFLFGDSDQSGNLITLTAAARPQVILGSLRSPSGSELGAPFYQYDFGGGTMPAPGFASLFVEGGAAVMSLRASPGNHHLTITADFKVSTPAGDEFFINYTISVDGPERITASFSVFITANRQGTKEESVSDSATLGSIIAVSGGELNDGSSYSFRMQPPGQVPALSAAGVTPAGLVTSDLLGGGLVTLRAFVDDDGIADPFLLFITARVPLPPPLSVGFTPAIPVAAPGATTKFTVSVSGGKNPFINGFEVGRTGKHHRITFNTPRSGGVVLFSTRLAHTLDFTMPETYRFQDDGDGRVLPAICELSTRQCPLPGDVWFATVFVANFFDGAYRIITNALTISPGTVGISVLRPIVARQNNTAPVPAATLLISGGVSPSVGEPYSVWVSGHDNITAFTAPRYTITLTIRVNTMNQEQELKIPRIIEGAQILAFKDARTVQAVTLTVAADDREELTPNGLVTVELTVAPPVQTGRDIVTIALLPNLPRATADAFAATLATLTSRTGVKFDANDNGSPDDSLRFLTFKPDTENNAGTVGYFVHIPGEGSQSNLVFSTVTLLSEAGLPVPQPVFVENASPAEQFSITVAQPLVGAYFYGSRPHTATLGRLTASGGYLVGYNAGAFYNYAFNHPALRAPQNVNPLTAGNHIVGILTLSAHTEAVTTERSFIQTLPDPQFPGEFIYKLVTVTTSVTAVVRKLNQTVTVRAFDDFRATLSREYKASYFLPSDTRLHAAAALGDIPALNAALAVSGVDKNAHAADGMTPLDLAVIYQQSAAETALRQANAGCGRTCPVTAFNPNTNPRLGGSVYLIGGGRGFQAANNSVIFVASDINPGAGFSPFATITANALLQRHGHRVIFANGTVVVAGGFNSNNNDAGAQQVIYSTDMSIWFTARAFDGAGLGRGQLYKLPQGENGVRIFYSGGYAAQGTSPSRHIYYSDNGGATWTKQSNAMPAASYNHAVANLNNTLYMMGVQGAGNGARFYRSTDGLQWTNVPMRELDLNPAQTPNYPGRPDERRQGMLMLAGEALTVNNTFSTVGKTPQFFFVGGSGAFQRNQQAGRSNMAVSELWRNNRPEQFNEPGQYVINDFTDASGWCVPAFINTSSPHNSRPPTCYSTHGTSYTRHLRQMIFPVAGNYCVSEGFNTCPRSTTPAFTELTNSEGANVRIIPEAATRAAQVLHIPRGVRARQGHNSALHEAAKAGDTVAIQTALDAGRPVNIVGADGNTPLHFAAAAANNSEAAVQLLLSNGANMFANAINNANQTPLDLALTANPPNTAAATKIKEAGGTCSTRTGAGC